MAFADTLPFGVIAQSGSTSVCGGTLATMTTSIALSGATIAANSQCQFSVTLIAMGPGQYTNTSGNVTSANGGSGGSASATITVLMAVIPTLNNWALALLGTLLLIAAMLTVRQRNA